MDDKKLTPDTNAFSIKATVPGERCGGRGCTVAADAVIHDNTNGQEWAVCNHHMEKLLEVLKLAKDLEGKGVPLDRAMDIAIEAVNGPEDCRKVVLS